MINDAARSTFQRATTQAKQECLLMHHALFTTMLHCNGTRVNVTSSFFSMDYNVHTEKC